MIRIITDSACDLPLVEAKSLGIEIIPLKVTFGNDEYLDGVTLSREEFFLKLIESSVLPKTSQISPFDFEEAFRKYPDDEILCITLSSKLSGTFQSAKIAATDFCNVTLVDSENVCVGEQILIKLAIKLISEGKIVQEIASILNEEKKKIRVIALLDTLEYLKKGGRIGTVTALVGNLLHIKPVIEVRDGKVSMLGKARGSLQGNNKLREKIIECNGINFNYPAAFAYSGLSDKLLDKYINDSRDLYPDNFEIEKYLIGCTIGTHVGPGAIAVAFFANSK